MEQVALKSLGHANGNLLIVFFTTIGVMTVVVVIAIYIILTKMRPQFYTSDSNHKRPLYVGRDIVEVLNNIDGSIKENTKILSEMCYRLDKHIERTDAVLSREHHTSHR
ncbi:MAG: hypothetical protein KatS3mg087_1657 [Patescibacteria group bacterium]|nr:MAG: hypothetical protein KatS3mg087_1657 [Patescibacteria group bacterium]